MKDFTKAGVTAKKSFIYYSKEEKARSIDGTLPVG
jgi:hypothetical protein